MDSGGNLTAIIYTIVSPSDPQCRHTSWVLISAEDAADQDTLLRVMVFEIDRQIGVQTCCEVDLRWDSQLFIREIIPDIILGRESLVTDAVEYWRDRPIADTQFVAANCPRCGDSYGYLANNPHVCGVDWDESGEYAHGMWHDLDLIDAYYGLD